MPRLNDDHRMPSSPPGLNNKQRMAAEEYLKTMDYKKAAIAGGYKPTPQSGYNIINKPHVRAYINERLEQMSREKVADAQEVLEYLTSVLRGEQTEQILANNEDGSQELVDKDSQVKDRLKAAELLGKRWGLYTEKTELVGQVPVVITGEDQLAD